MAKLAARDAGSGAGMPAMMAGSRTGWGGEEEMSWCGVSSRSVVSGEPRLAGAGEASVPNIGTSGLRGCPGVRLGLATVGAAETSGVGGRLRASSAGGKSSSVGIRWR